MGWETVTVTMPTRRASASMRETVGREYPVRRATSSWPRPSSQYSRATSSRRAIRLRVSEAHMRSL